MDNCTMKRTSLMFVATGPEIDDLYLRFVVWFHQNVLLKSAGKHEHPELQAFFTNVPVHSIYKLIRFHSRLFRKAGTWGSCPPNLFFSPLYPQM